MFEGSNEENEIMNEFLISFPKLQKSFFKNVHLKEIKILSEALEIV